MIKIKNKFEIIHGEKRVTAYNNVLNNIVEYINDGIPYTEYIMLSDSADKLPFGGTAGPRLLVAPAAYYEENSVVGDEPIFVSKIVTLPANSVLDGKTINSLGFCSGSGSMMFNQCILTQNGGAGIKKESGVPLTIIGTVYIDIEPDDNMMPVRGSQKLGKYFLGLLTEPLNVTFAMSDLPQASNLLTRKNAKITQSKPMTRAGKELRFTVTGFANDTPFPEFIIMFNNEPALRSRGCRSIFKDYSSAIANTPATRKTHVFTYPNAIQLEYVKKSSTNYYGPFDCERIYASVNEVAVVPTGAVFDALNAGALDYSRAAKKAVAINGRELTILDGVTLNPVETEKKDITFKGVKKAVMTENEIFVAAETAGEGSTLTRYELLPEKIEKSAEIRLAESVTDFCVSGGSIYIIARNSRRRTCIYKYAADGDMERISETEYEAERYYFDTDGTRAYMGKGRFTLFKDNSGEPLPIPAATEAEICAASQFAVSKRYIATVNGSGVNYYRLDTFDKTTLPLNNVRKVFFLKNCNYVWANFEDGTSRMYYFNSHDKQFLEVTVTADFKHKIKKVLLFDSSVAVIAEDGGTYALFLHYDKFVLHYAEDSFFINGLLLSARMITNMFVFSPSSQVVTLNFTIMPVYS